MAWRRKCAIGTHHGKVANILPAGAVASTCSTMALVNALLVDAAAVAAFAAVAAVAAAAVVAFNYNDTPEPPFTEQIVVRNVYFILRHC